MIEEIPAPGNAVGWKFSGKVTSEDYAGVRERVGDFAATGECLAVLCVVEEDAQWGIDSLVADSGLARYTMKIGRVAVVAAPSWTATLVFVADLWPGWSVRHFAPSSRAAAERWLAIGSNRG